MTTPYSFDPELASAATLPADWYRDPALLERERAAVFGRTWQLTAFAEQLTRPGDFVTASIGGEEIVVTRAEDGLHAFSNVCRHRAGPVARGCGQRKSLQCAYHGWTYGLDGRLLTTPEWDFVRGFDRERHGLPRFRVDVFGPLVFVNLDPKAPPLAEVLGEIPKESAPLGLHRMRRYRTHDWEVACNWKVYVDNYLEGYHIPIVHPGLFQQLDYAAYRVETARQHSKQHAPIRARAADSLYLRNLSEGQVPEALYYWLFPNLMLNIYPDNVQVNVIVPLSAERTLTRFEWLVADPDRPGLAQEFEASFAFSDLVQQEDITICESVQRGLGSRFYAQGRYSVLRENGVHHFHGLLARALS